MKQLLVVFNTCGISGRENVSHYIQSLESFLCQDYDFFDIVISSCMASKDTKQILLDTFTNQVYYNFIDEILPVNVTFNHSVLETVKRNGNYAGYLYVDSGVTLDINYDFIKEMMITFKNGNYGMLSARTDTDSGTDLWFGGDQIFTNDVFDIPVGKAVNLHLQIFSNHLLLAYNKLMPDIFASYCTESTFSFLNAAIKMKWGIMRAPIARHIPMMDGQSAGFSPPKWAAAGKSLIDHPFKVDSILPLVQGGHQYGLGYEECQNVLIHDKSQFDENGYCKNEKLKEYIKDNLFLSKTLFNYDEVKSEYVVG